MIRRLTRRQWGGWMCALMLFGCIVLIHPVAEMGIGDDWSYVDSTRWMAATGRVVYNGWATAMVGAQLWFGALFIKLFGTSYLAVRSATMTVAVLSAPLMYALMLRCGIAATNAVLGTLTLLLSPVYLPLATTAMTDANALFLLLLFFYAAVRCVQARTDRAALLWLAGAVIAGLLSGTVRQIAWLSVLVWLPCLAWHQRRRKSMLLLGAALWGISALIVRWIMHWFKRQMYACVDGPYWVPRNMDETLHILLPRIVQSAFSFALVLLPVLFAIALCYPVRERKRVWQLIAFTATATAFVTAETIAHGKQWWFTWLVGDQLMSTGLLWPEIAGPIPSVVPGLVQVGITLFLLVTLFAAGAAIYQRFREPGRPERSETDRMLLMAGAPFILCYLGLVYTRYVAYDRYFVPLMLVAAFAGVRWLGRRASRYAFVPLLGIAAFGVAGMHDRFAQTRARLEAINEIRAAGVPRAQIEGGFEYDAETELATAGYVNDSRLNPRALYHPVKEPTGKVAPCLSWFHTHTPSVRPRYVLQTVPIVCFGTAPFAPVHYHAWLPERGSTVYVGDIPTDVNLP